MPYICTFCETVGAIRREQSNPAIFDNARRALSKFMRMPPLYFCEKTEVNMRHFSLRLPSARTAGAFCALAAGMVLLNFALPQQEPAAFLLLWATFTVLRAYVAGTICYLGASVVFLSWQGTLCCLIQAAVLLLAFGICARLKFNPGEWRILFAAAAQIPFVFLFPHSGYALFPLPVLAQKAVIAVFFLLACVLTEGGVRAAMNASRCRLKGAELAEAALLWLLLGMGICTALGQLVYTGIAIFFVLLAAALFKNAVPVPLSIVLSLPLCVAQVSVSPLALFAVYACCALLVAPYGRIASALALLLAYLAAQYFAGMFSLSATEIVFSLLACVLPAAIVCSLPKKLLSRMQDSLLFYRERVLPRIAVNRNRRAVGERLYEVSALFREIESAFLLPEPEDDGDRRITAKVDATVCGACARAKTCPREKTMPALERLVRVGRAKGKANLIDLPADLAQNCPNVAGILFTLNKELESDSRRIAANETAREGRLLLARQAHGVSEIMRDLALKESEEYALSSGEDVLAKTLQEYGILSSEIFVYGEGGTLTVSMTLDETVPAKKACLAASEALGASLALAEKLPLTSGRACYVFKRKPRFDAAFGIAACPKQGEAASGDTHSILKIDERRFLVALSDGMGSGDAARDVSSRTLSLMESFYKTGMPSDTVLATVNSLISYSADERFSCLDLAAVNLDDGNADIVKIGSPAGFLLTAEELKILEGQSLPMGALDAVHPATMRITMHENDFLVFLSDGITSAFGSSADLCAYLGSLRPLNPQSLAENVLAAALARSPKGEAGDDMTVVTVKLTAAA